MRSDRVVVLPPFLDDDLCFLQAVEDFAVQQLIAQFCCDIPASRQATGVGLPCAIDTSIWRSSVTICSALNLFFGMTSSFPSYSLTTLGLKKPGQVSVLWSTHRKHYGPGGDPLILVAQGTSREFNPSLPQSVVDRALERDHAAASAEYLAQFRTDIETFVPYEVVQACVGDHNEMAPLPNTTYHAFVDPSGGSADSFSCAAMRNLSARGALCIS